MLKVLFHRPRKFLDDPFLMNKVLTVDDQSDVFVSFKMGPNNILTKEIFYSQSFNFNFGPVGHIIMNELN